MIEWLWHKLNIMLRIVKVFPNRELRYLLMTTSSQGHPVEEVLVVEEGLLDLRATEQALMGLVLHPWQEVTWDMQHTLQQHM